MTAIQTMSPLDESFFHIEDDATHMHTGSVGIFEARPQEVAAAIAAQLCRRCPADSETVAERHRPSDASRVPAEAARR
jgi:hypothetical protein